MRTVDLARWCAWFLLMAAGLHATVRTAPLPPVSAAAAVEAAVRARLGRDVDVTVTIAGLSGDAAIFREARPDPSARLGRPLRFTFVTVDGALLPGSAEVRVLGTRTIARRALARGDRLTGDDVTETVGELVDVPLKPLPAAHELVGARVLQPIAAGAVVLPGTVLLRREVERGDPVVAIAAGVAIEVTATLAAADGGRAGDVIRVVNPETKRYLRARIVRKGLVEVINGR
ncbi:MAG: flagellar basal body P-ring formation protein FlgA [Acidobacteria bacterium]|nr:flagellar basal body P-ring formation protein FlgA [Acidobacteriota bacterium]